VETAPGSQGLIAIELNMFLPVAAEANKTAKPQVNVSVQTLALGLAKGRR
jgi:hypothetical protein